MISKTTIATETTIKQASKVKRTWQEIVPTEYHNHAKTFSEEEARRFPPSCPWDHEIKLTPDAPRNMDCKTYPLTLKEQDAVDKYIKEQEEKGYISLSISPYASQIFFVKKKDGTL